MKTTVFIDECIQQCPLLEENHGNRNILVSDMLSN